MLVNEREEIISYAHFVGKSCFLVFPDIKEKVSFVSELFKTYLPELFPRIFPFHGELGWLTNGEYLLPREQELTEQRDDIEKRYIQEIKNNEELLNGLRRKYKFLSDMISETGDNLVSAVEEYLNWLEFESVVNLDETDPDILEEDIQVDCGEKFLVIEIKGIGGTSTDNACSQIGKIRHRRAEQRGKFDVFGLYIVNHQRYMPPKSRANPPFTDNQVRDAELDKRGLLTTYEMYKAYLLVERGILTKATIREALFRTGLIEMAPTNLVSIGIPEKYYKDGEVAIVDISGITVHQGDNLIVKMQDTYFKVTVESIHLNDQDVRSANSGKVGIKLSQKLKGNAELFIQRA